MPDNAGRHVAARIDQFSMGKQMTSNRNLEGKRVVICEDAGITVMQLDRILRRAGLEVVGTANNGRDAAEIILREKPDLVLMDIGLPITDGVGTIRQIAAQFTTCIVMLTGSADEEQLERA